jgi:hypothetical protein
VDRIVGHGGKEGLLLSDRIFQRGLHLNCQGFGEIDILPVVFLQVRDGALLAPLDPAETIRSVVTARGPIGASCNIDLKPEVMGKLAVNTEWTKMGLARVDGMVPVRGQ